MEGTTSDFFNNIDPKSEFRTIALCALNPAAAVSA